MQKIGNIINLNQPEIPSGVKTTKALKSLHSNLPQSLHKAIDLLFRSFAVTYGHVWRSQFKPEEFLAYAKNEWAEALKDFTSDTILKATVQSRKLYEFPPTLPQVMGLCKVIKEREIPPKPQEEFKRASPEVVKFHLEQIKILKTKLGR